MNKVTIKMDAEKDCFIASLPILTIGDRVQEMMYYSIENFTHTRVFICLEDEMEDPIYDVRLSIYSAEEVCFNSYQIDEIIIENVGKEAIAINRVRIEPGNTYIFK